MLMAAKKPTYEQLIALAAGELSPQEAAAVADAVSADPAASGDLARLQRLFETLRADESVSAPAALIAEAKSIFKPRPAVSILDWLNDLGRTVATLVFDSRVQPALAGFRRSAATVEFELSFTLGETEIDLQIHAPAAEDDSGRIRGQIHLMPPFADCEIALVRPGGELVAQARPDGDGMFALDAPRGEYEMLVRMADRVAVLPGVNVGR